MAQSYHAEDLLDSFNGYDNTISDDVDEDIYSFLDGIQTEQQFLATFDPENYEEDMLIANEIKETDSFQLRRSSSIQMQYGLTADEYDVQHTHALENIMLVADLLHIDYNPYITTYSDIMFLIDRNLSRVDSTTQTDVIDLLMDIRASSHLFTNRHTLLHAIDEDAVLQAIIHLDKAINWMINKVHEKKCEYCLNIAGYVRRKACGAAGGAVCEIIAKVSGGFAGTIRKYGCGSPVNMSSKLSTLCNNAVQYFTRNTRASDRSICQNVRLPTLSWSTHSNAFYKISGRTVNFGTPC